MRLRTHNLRRSQTRARGQLRARPRRRWRCRRPDCCGAASGFRQPNFTRARPLWRKNSPKKGRKQGSHRSTLRVLRSGRAVPLLAPAVRLHSPTVGARPCAADGRASSGQLRRRVYGMSCFRDPIGHDLIELHSYAPSRVPSRVCYSCPALTSNFMPAAS